MHKPGPVRSELGLLTPLYPISGFVHAPVREESPGVADAMHFPGESGTGASWERRCMRKHRRSPSNEGSSPKRRRLMGEVGSPLWDIPGSKRWPGWAPRGDGSLPDPAPGLQLGPGPALAPGPAPACGQLCPVPENRLAYPGPPLPPQPCPKPGGLRTEVEAAQRRLQEIEERITLEDDDEDEDLEVEPAQNRPVLVMSQSLREGLQQGLGDILPQNVAESVSRSCMELVVWRPPEEVLPRRLKDSLQKQRKQVNGREALPAVGTRPPAAAQASGSAPSGLYCGPAPLPSSPTPAGLYCSPTPEVSTEEEMEL
ncbi:coiled-coil domain-containing protein 117 [Anguilla anguilla]|uniref:coiled-coil domain-containing protein 117 n=1 Tax=Anguilla anguilla TaxID=7936 RepID=UPI0015AE75E6|nr:coiled-coil domain-containing protein 117 [Anguilla anguilla]